MKNQTFTRGHFGRQLALGAATLLLVLSATHRGQVAASDHGNAWGRYQNSQRGQATPASANAQRPQPRVPWWKDPAIIKEIDLTPDQTNRIDGIWRKRETDMQAVAKEFERQRDELSRLMAERKVGIDVISLQNDRVEAQRTILNKSRTIMLYQISLILSAEQNTALKAYWERNRRDRR